ncbi:MAG: methylated-DNA--[protein]-cysteine S-methyltransferase [Sulfuricurvum sp.]|nr:methylated-DNA--[protein]-cysteine S-methyltransferase [Sulfuricurvum sp.]
MNPTEFSLFDTAIGKCGIIWKDPDHAKGDQHVIGFQLPEATEQLTEARIVERWKANRARIIPMWIDDIIKRVKLHFKGKNQDFCDIKLDLDGIGSFAKQIYDTARAIPSGQTMSYGQLAEAAGHSGAARAVGLAMSKNPIPLIIPCHRVLAASSKPGGFSAHGGLATKIKMLDIEGATFGSPATIKSMRDLKRAATELGKKDPLLASILSHPIDFRLMPEDSIYETLVRAVVHQQLSPRAAETILGRVMTLSPDPKLPEPAMLLKIPDDQLRSAGLSRSKIKALKDIATHALNGTIPSSEEILMLNNNEIIKRLTSIYGVGRWTVEMMLIFNLGRIDVLPVDDYSLRSSIAKVYGMDGIPTPKQVERLGEIWRPYRTVASLYFWNLKDKTLNQ